MTSWIHLPPTPPARWGKRLDSQTGLSQGRSEKKSLGGKFWPGNRVEKMVNTLCFDVLKSRGQKRLPVMAWHILLSSKPPTTVSSTLSSASEPTPLISLQIKVMICNNCLLPLPYGQKSSQDTLNMSWGKNLYTALLPCFILDWILQKNADSQKCKEKLQHLKN